jgi:hypothetical protein
LTRNVAGSCLPLHEGAHPSRARSDGDAHVATGESQRSFGQREFLSHIGGAWMTPGRRGAGATPWIIDSWLSRVCTRASRLRKRPGSVTASRRLTPRWSRPWCRGVRGLRAGPAFTSPARGGPATGSVGGRCLVERNRAGAGHRFPRHRAA